jgi:predicted metalloprotease with PDZ domain
VLSHIRARSFLLLTCFAAAAPLLAASPPIQITADLTDAPRKFLHARMTIPVHPGPLTLVYPQWIPGEHGPTGPVDNFTGITFIANGQTLPWTRDPVDMFTFHVQIPADVSKLEAKVDFLATAAPSGFSAGASTNANLAVLSWNEFTLYPAGMPAADVTFEPSVKLPDGWKFGTALAESSSEGDLIHFRPVSLEMLVDSPLLTGRFFKEVALAPEITPKHFVDMAADGPEDLNITPDQIEAFSNLVRETGVLFGSRHYNSYHFLLTLSDSVAHFGLEHHQSSDDRVDASTYLDDDLMLLEGDLLPHEFTHSWNGKYRRPIGLATANYQQPMKGNMLWVYEGLTQYLGDVLAVRSGIWTVEFYRAYLAASAAEMDHRPGRTWRDLEDTAVSAQILYDTNSKWDNWRRSVDYYQEGELIWLEADTIIRKHSKNRRSLNDFCLKFLGLGGNTPPEIVPYTFEELVKTLDSVEHYDWAGFFNERLTSKSPQAPLGGIDNAGYRVQYADASNLYIRAAESSDRGLNAWYSLGLAIEDGSISDVLVDSPAYKAGLGPGMKLVAVNGRAYTDELLRQAIRDAKGSGPAVELIVESSKFFKVLKIDYHDGVKYPRLVREEKTPDLIEDVVKPLAKHTSVASLAR